MSYDKYFDVVVCRRAGVHVQEAIESERVYDENDAVELMQAAMEHYRCAVEAYDNTTGVIILVYSGIEGVVGRDVRYVGMI